MALPDRPIHAILDPAWAHYAAIVNACNFSDGAGAVATALLGDNWEALAGAEDTNFEWSTALGGGVFAYLDTTAGGGLKGPSAAEDETRTQGTIVAIVKGASGGRIWNTGSILPTGDGQALLNLQGIAGQVRANSATVSLTVSPTLNVDADTWYLLVARWTTTALHVWVTDGTTTYAAENTSLTNFPGVKILTGTREGLCGIATAGSAISIASFLRLDEAISDENVAAIIASPWAHLKSPVPFVTDRPQCDRSTTTSLSVCMTTDPAYPDAVDMRCLWYSESARTTLVATGTTATSSGGEVEENLVSVATGLTAGVKYYPVLQYRLVAGTGDWVEHEAVRDNCSYRTLPAGAAVVLKYSDPHNNEETNDAMSVHPAAQTNADKYARFANFMTAAADDDAHLCVSGGDDKSSPTEDAAWASAYQLARRQFYRPLLDVMPVVTIEGNHDSRNTDTPPTFSQVQEDARLRFYINPSAASARETYGKIECDAFKQIFAEPFTQSGYPVTNEAFEAELDATSLAFVLDEIESCTQPVLMLDIHVALAAGEYVRLGGANIIQEGTQSETVHAALLALKALRPEVIIIVSRGHDHTFEVQKIDGVWYLSLGTPSTLLGWFGVPADVVAAGYWADEAGTLPATTLYLGRVYGYVRLRFSGNSGWLEVVQTTTGETDADDTVVFQTALHDRRSIGAMGLSVGMGIGL